MKKNVLAYALFACMLGSCSSDGIRSFDTDYFRIDVNSKGYVVGMWDRTKENRNFSPVDQPSPLLTLYNSQLKRYYYPEKAHFSHNKYRLEYGNGSIATVRLEEKSRYLKLTLEALENREGIDSLSSDDEGTAGSR